MGKYHYKSKLCRFCKKSFKPHSGSQYYCSSKCAFWDRVELGHSHQCWIWPYTKNIYGYGLFRFRQIILAHRFMWEQIFDKIPKGLNVLHACDNRSCINPTHLFLGTQRDNVKDMVLKGRTAKGENHSQTKLTNNEIKDIRQLLLNGISPKYISLIYNIARSQVSCIKTRKTWSHV